jgi:MOSC domain-containing protein YiiM
VLSRGRIHNLAISQSKGSKKDSVDQIELLLDYGIHGDAHGGSERQVSLLPFESFAQVQKDIADIAPGDFAENITTVGLDFTKVTVGCRLRVGSTIHLVVTQVGKECHHGCYIREIIGDCIMPRQGVFARVEQGGCARVGDTISVVTDAI